MSKNYWLSFWLKEEMGGFELHSPWWFSGERGDGSLSVCAAVQADTEEAARSAVEGSFDTRPLEIEWRFCEERPQTWIPFGDRFPRAEWMQWKERPND